MAAAQPASGGVSVSSSNASTSERAQTLYAELTNDQATWVDAVFWLVLGAVLAEGAHWLVRMP